MNKLSTQINKVHTLIIFLLMFGFGSLPPLFELTPIGMKIIGVLFGLIYGWATVGLLWPSLIGLGAIAIHGIMPMSELLQKGFGSETTILVIFFCIFAAAISETGVSKNIAMWIVTRKCFIGKPWVFITAFFLVAALLSAATTTSGAVILCWGIFYMIAEALGYEKKSSWAEYMVFGIVYSALLGMALLPFKVLPLTLLGVYQQLSNMTISYANYILFNAPVCILSIILFVLIGKYLFKIDVTLLKNLNPDLFGDGFHISFTKKQKIIMFFLVMIVFLLILPGFLPNTHVLKQFFNSLGISGILIVAFGLMAIIKVDDEPLFNFATVASKGMLWDVVMLLAVLMPMIGLLASSGTGINETLAMLFTPLFVNKSSLFFLIALTVLIIIATNLCNQAVAGVVFLTIFYETSLQLGVSGVVITLLLNFCAHLAILTPAGSPITAVLCSNIEWIRIQQVYKYGVVAVLGSVIILLVVGLPIAAILNL